MKKIILVTMVLIMLTAGCAGLTPTEQRTLSGTALGAAGGAIVGAIAGDAGVGALIGGAAGATGGFLYGKHKESEDAAYRRGYEQGRRSQ